MATSIAALAACGGTTTPTVQGFVQSPNATYEELVSTNATTSALGGKTMVVSGLASSTSAPPIGDVTGTLQHDTGATVIGANGSAGQISDADGADANGQIVDDTIGFTANLTGGYDFVRQLGGGFNQWNGYIGVETVAADIPASSTAVFNGQAYGSTTLSNNLNGNATTVTANFGSPNGTVDVAMQVNQGGSSETIDLTGMTISGTEFSGGTLVVTRDGTVQDVTSFDQYAEGNFYGYDPAYGGPDEVGAIISTRGNDGGINVVLVGD